MGRTARLAYVPTARQAAFHQASADEVLYGGAAGGGKSRALVMEALMRCLEHAGTAAYLFRRTYGELEDTLLSEALAAIPPELGKYEAKRHDFRLINGSVLRFRHCQRAQDRFRYQGAEINWLFIDEVTHFTQEMYDFLKSRLRAKVTLGIRPVVRCAGNPGGIGHAWVKGHFVDAGAAGEKVQKRVFSQALGEMVVSSTQYIPARASDNPHIGKGYIAELERKPKALRDALLHGRWDAFEGQVFDEWRNDEQGYLTQENSHVIAPFPLPEEWPRYRSFDFGYARPFSVGWWAVGPEGACYRYREWYGARGPNEGVKMSPCAIAQGIREAEAEHEAGLFVHGVADPSIWDASRGPCVAEQMAGEGVHFVKGDNARLAGKTQLHERLRFDEEGRAGLYVFTNCVGTIRTLPALCYDASRVEDVDTTGEDHIYDEMRYFLMERPLGPKKKAKRRVYNPLEG